MVNTFNHKKALYIFISLVSLNTPLSRSIIFSSGLAILALLPTSKLGFLPLRSVYESLFHWKLYSYGLTRSLSMILHGEFLAAWELNKLAYLVLIIVFILLINDIHGLYKNRRFSF